jgi:hypothetical protein
MNPKLAHAKARLPGPLPLILAHIAKLLGGPVGRTLGEEPTVGSGELDYRHQDRRPWSVVAQLKGKSLQ